MEIIFTVTQNVINYHAMFSIGDSLEGLYLTTTAGYEIASEYNMYCPIFITFQRNNDFLA